MRVFALLLVLAGCALGGELEVGPDAAGINPPPDPEPLECPADPCDLIESVPGSPIDEYIGDGLRAFQCMRAEIDACGECRTWHCDELAVSVCSRACGDPEP